MKLGTYNYGTHEAFDTHGVSLGTFPVATKLSRQCTPRACR